MIAVNATAEKTLHGARLEDYALIGDCETAALVSRNGSIDWLCWPNFSSAACFAALLGTEEHGFFCIRPDAEEEIVDESWHYRPHTLIVEKTWITQTGEVLVSDFMPPRDKHSDIVRIVEGRRGTVKMRMDLVLRFDYGRTVPWVQSVDHHMRAIAGPELVVLRTEAPLHGEDLTTVSHFEIHEGEKIHFVLSYGSSLEEDPEAFDVEDAYRETEAYWTMWSAKSSYQGAYKEAVERSLITLKALTYRPTGGLVAAPTTSLPEQIGGVRNWDYRYCWLRDSAFTLLVLLGAGYNDEALAWRRWLLRAIAGSAEQIQTLYGISGERQLVEWSVDWLPGYENSRPVNIGNKAADQLQLDVFGEVIAALANTPATEEDVWDPAVRSLAVHMLEYLERIWHLPDSGIWETRGPEQQFVHSKVMSWVAFDQAIKAYERALMRRAPGSIDPSVHEKFARWRVVRETIHREVCEKGFDTVRNSFVQAYGSTKVDASLLRLALVGFLPGDDPRIEGTLTAIEKILRRGDMVLRYETDGSDGLPPGEGAFLACSFWMVSTMHLCGRTQEACEMFERLLLLRNPLGLFAEEYDVKLKRQVGNFPQAFTHLALSHTAMLLNGSNQIG